MAENLIPVPTIEAIRAHLDEIIKIVRVVEAVLDDEVEKHKEPEQVIRSVPPVPAFRPPSDATSWYAQ